MFEPLGEDRTIAAIGDNVDVGLDAVAAELGDLTAQLALYGRGVGGRSKTFDLLE